MLYDFPFTQLQEQEAQSINKGKVTNRYQRDDGTQIITFEFAEDPYIWWKNKWRRWPKKRTIDQVKK